MAGDRQVGGATSGEVWSRRLRPTYDKRVEKMNSILKRLRKLGDNELCSISDAIDSELERRQELAEAIPESARRRAIQREQSYRARNGASALPVRVAGLRKIRRRRKAA